MAKQGRSRAGWHVDASEAALDRTIGRVLEHEAQLGKMERLLDDLPQEMKRDKRETGTQSLAGQRHQLSDARPWALSGASRAIDADRRTGLTSTTVKLNKRQRRHAPRQHDMSVATCP
ncbi:MAG: hypothetical protein IPO88_32350 [Nannocystis sp.]|uniref:hypothetical protein n=1 Tax=Nannocystis sp. TaxID=1962667 RepID=UPI0024223E63|nr:hypothetical protein [Nannocystis sp.]MBK9758127.1 hypothetical protein [Nannocystis sp.]